MTVLDELLALQHTDSSLDRLVQRRSQSPEHDAVVAAHGALRAWEKRHAEVQGELDELARQIRAEEARGVDLSAEQQRLEQQLRRVIAPREAEALMHEIDTNRQRHSELDDTELEHLETQERLDAEIDQLDGQEATVRTAAEQADAALGTHVQTVEAEIVAATERRTVQRQAIPADVLARYEQLRASSDGVAIARLNGRQCEGCHLEVSTAELDALKATPPGQLPECPQCGRILVV